MKKLLFVFGLATASLLSAQSLRPSTESVIEKGTVVLETSVLSNMEAPSTGFGYTSVLKDGPKMFNVGVNGGVFVADNFALKGGLGYGEMRYNEKSYGQTWSYRVGAEYNVNGTVPLEVAWTGASIHGADNNPSYLSTQLGYNLFMADNFALKPLVRYNISLTDYYRDTLSFGVGFGYYF